MSIREAAEYRYSFIIDSIASKLRNDSIMSSWNSLIRSFFTIFIGIFERSTMQNILISIYYSSFYLFCPRIWRINRQKTAMSFDWLLFFKYKQTKRLKMVKCFKNTKEVMTISPLLFRQSARKCFHTILVTSYAQQSTKIICYWHHAIPVN